ncbi:hypothetical protein AGLY_008085 [Aphis glycines]|uniref:Uncharacterized protein n=1 Tax=Aphis glycines TaxID=307491 RepID=A0A6G0TM36_APHGL|nr:hypothetical protein AGLY_008085 [Aphis glycines]
MFVVKCRVIKEKKIQTRYRIEVWICILNNSLSSQCFKRSIKKKKIITLLRRVERISLMLLIYIKIIIFDSQLWDYFYNLTSVIGRGLLLYQCECPRIKYYFSYEAISFNHTFACYSLLKLTPYSAQKYIFICNIMLFYLFINNNSTEITLIFSQLNIITGFYYSILFSNVNT